MNSDFALTQYRHRQPKVVQLLGSRVEERAKRANSLLKSLDSRRIRDFSNLAQETDMAGPGAERVRKEARTLFTEMQPAVSELAAHERYIAKGMRGWLPTIAKTGVLLLGIGACICVPQLIPLAPFIGAGLIVSITNDSGGRRSLKAAAREFQRLAEHWKNIEAFQGEAPAR